MKTKILTAIAMLLIIVSVAGCASSKPMPDAAQLQTPASTAEQPLLQELRESVDESKATDSHTEAKPEETAEKEMITSTPQTEPVQTEPPRNPHPTAITESTVESRRLSRQSSLPADRAEAHRAGAGTHQTTAAYGTPKACEPAPTEPSSTDQPSCTGSHKTPATGTCGCTHDCNASSR